MVLCPGFMPALTELAVSSKWDESLLSWNRAQRFDGELVAR